MLEQEFPYVAEWETTGDISRDTALATFEEFDAIMETGLGEAEAFLRRDDPIVAYALFTRLTNFVGAAGQKIPGIIRKLATWVQRLTNFLSQLAGQLGADEFSITVTAPAIVSVGLTFKAPSPPSGVSPTP